jgi:hypothetical protein
MNRKQFTILLVLVAVLGAAGLMVYNKRNDATKAGDPTLGKKLLADLPVNDVTHLALKQGTNELNLVKKDDFWRVRERNDYLANYSEISDFLLKARDLKVLESEKVGPSEMQRLGLVPGQATNAALVVEMKGQNDKPIRTLLLGKKHMRKSNRPSPMGEMGGDEGWPDGRYVKVGDADAVALISEAFSNLEPKPEQWLNKDFFKVEKVRAISVTFPVETNSWKASRETENGGWKLAGLKAGEEPDSSKTSSLSNPLSSPSFNDVLAGKPEEHGLDKGTVVTLDTFDNFSYTLKVGPKTNDNYALALTVSAQLPKERTPGKDEKPEDKDKLDKEFKEKQKKLEEKLAQEKAYEKWTYLVSSWTLEPVLKERNQLLVEKKDEKKDEKKEEKPADAAAVNPADAVPVPAAETKGADAK